MDTVIVTSRPAGPDDLTFLAAVHARLAGKPHFDGVYLDPDTFAERAADHRHVPFVVNGEFRTGTRCGELGPVLWFTLHRYGIAVRGPAVTELGPYRDEPALRPYNLDNLREYWPPLATEIRKYVAGRADDEPVDADGVEWTILGPARLHHTLAHTDVISKSAAGAYLGDLFPAWAELARRAVRWRSGLPEAFTVADLGASADAADAVAVDAWARWGDR